MRQPVYSLLFILCSIFNLSNAFAIDVPDPKQHAFHAFVNDGLYGITDIALSTDVDSVDYRPDITMPTGVIVDELFLKIAFKIGITPDINRITQIRCETNHLGQNQNILQVFDTPLTQFHSKVIGNYLILVNNYVDGVYESEPLNESCTWKVSLNGTDDVAAMEVYSTYHNPAGTDTSGNAILPDFYAEDGYTSTTQPFTGQSTLAQVDINTSDTHDNACNVMSNGVAVTPVSEGGKDNLIVLLHNWNPTGKKNNYAPGPLNECPFANSGTADDLEFSYYQLNKQLQASALINSSWNVARYDWSEDANTGEIIFDNDYDSANEVRDRAHVHGLKLGKIIAHIAPKKVQFIAHGAGNWTARRAADYLQKSFGEAIEVELVALDPYVNDADPVALAEDLDFEDSFDITTLWLDSLYNYYVIDDPTDTPGHTSGNYSSWTGNLRLDNVPDYADRQELPDYAAYMDDHKGPISWYAKTIERFNTTATRGWGFSQGLPFKTAEQKFDADLQAEIAGEDSTTYYADNVSVLKIRLPLSASYDAANEQITALLNYNVVIALDKYFPNRDALVAAAALAQPYHIWFTSATEPSPDPIEAVFDASSYSLMFNVPTTEPFSLVGLDYPTENGSEIILFEDLDKEAEVLTGISDHERLGIALFMENYLAPIIEDKKIGQVITGYVAGEHSGIDFRATVGTSIYSPVDGTVVENDISNGILTIEFDQDGQTYNLIFLHLSEILAQFTVGASVTQGELIAKTGETLYNAVPISEAHLHVEIRAAGQTQPSTPGDLTDTFDPVDILQVSVTLPIALNDSLLLYYPFDGNANDASGNAHHGTENGDVSYTQGISQQAVSMDGVSDWIVTPEMAHIANNDFTVSIWLKYPDQAGGTFDYATAFIQSTNFNPPYEGATIFLDIGSNNLMAFRIVDGEMLFSSTLNLNNDQWRYFTYIKSGTNLSIFINGILAASKDVSAFNEATLSPIFLGANHQNQDNQNYEGLMDELRIYARALNHSEIQALYNQGNPPFNNTGTHVISETPEDYTQQTQTFTKTWDFNEDISNYTVSVLSSTYASNSVPAANGNQISIELTPDLAVLSNRIDLQLKDTNGDIVKVDYSDTFWSISKTNHAPRLASSQQTKMVGPVDALSVLTINTFDADGDVVTLSVMDADGGTVSFNGNQLNAEFADTQTIHIVQIALNDGKQTVLVDIPVLRFTDASIQSFYSDVDTLHNFSKEIAFATLAGVIWGDPDINNTQARIFRPDADVTWAEALVMVLKAAAISGKIDISDSATYLQTIPAWLAPYYNFAREQGAIAVKQGDLRATYPNREEIAMLIVRVLGLGEALADYPEQMLDFTDKAEFSDALMDSYGQIAHLFGLFMTSNTANPQASISRAELAQVIAKLLMMPMADINILDNAADNINGDAQTEADATHTVEYGDPVSIDVLLNKFAQVINDQYQIVDNADHLTVQYAINFQLLTTLSIDSATLNIGSNTLIALINNQGVKNVIRKQIMVTFTDSDVDGVQDANDIWPNDYRYQTDTNGNNIPDVLDDLYGLAGNTPTDEIVVEGMTITVQQLIDDGGLICQQVITLAHNPVTNEEREFASPCEVLLGWVLGPSPLANYHAALDVTKDGTVDALSDGLLLLRYLFGFRGDSLTTGITDIPSAIIEATIANNLYFYDIDGNGLIDALTDGLLMVRYAFGFSGDALLNGIVAADAVRSNAEIEAYLLSLATQNNHLFADLALRDCVNESLGLPLGERASVAELASLTMLTCMDKNIVNLAGIEQLSDLEDLQLVNNKIVNLDPLAGFVALTNIDLSSNCVNDFTPVDYVANVVQLNQGGFQCQNIEMSATSAQITQNDVSNIANTSMTTLAQTDCAGGTLTQVDLYYEMNLSSDYSFFNASAGNASATVNIEHTQLDIQVGDLAIVAATLNSFDQTWADVPPGGTDLTVDPVVPHPTVVSETAFAEGPQTSITESAELLQFTGTGVVDVALTSAASLSVTAPGTWDSNHFATAQGRVGVVYSCN